MLRFNIVETMKTFRELTKFHQETLDGYLKIVLKVVKSYASPSDVIEMFDKKLKRSPADYKNKTQRFNSLYDKVWQEVFDELYIQEYCLDKFNCEISTEYANILRENFSRSNKPLEEVIETSLHVTTSLWNAISNDIKETLVLNWLQDHGFIVKRLRDTCLDLFGEYYFVYYPLDTDYKWDDTPKKGMLWSKLSQSVSNEHLEDLSNKWFNENSYEIMRLSDIFIIFKNYPKENSK